MFFCVRFSELNTTVWVTEVGTSNRPETTWEDGPADGTRCNVTAEKGVVPLRTAASLGRHRGGVAPSRPGSHLARRETTASCSAGALTPRFSALPHAVGLSLLFLLKVLALSCASKFEAELKAEQEERRREEEKRRLRQAAFRELKATFST